MNAAPDDVTPEDDSTTAAGDGWSEDMELAPAHPGDRPATGSDDDRQGERLQKVLARAGIGSRRVSEDMIEAGRISVNGKQVAVQGMRVDPSVDKIAVDGVRIEIRDDRVTYAMNKPPGVITAMSDDRNRPTVGDLVGDLAKGLVHVGRLDQDTEGLLLLTTDGELAHRLAHPSYGVQKTYLAQVSGSVPRDLYKRLRSGVELEDGPVVADSFRVVDTHAGQSVVEVVLHEGRKHIVRRLLAHVGLPVSRLTRTAVGPIELRAMRSGTIRKLSREELGALQELVGL
ncbi:MAG: putative Ribosomal large subunit pseudouridine synthase [Blastococcus sp.]|jgi:23S rRNA pseudouridine2605 synthase|nr:putative Ribosomal large subunit pseudouridine synthase [Blastococcus sp.]